MEVHFIKVDGEIKALEEAKVETVDKTTNMELVMTYVEYFLEHLEE